MLVKGDDGEERAFVNVCRHRGSVVVEEAGNRRTLQCPYHAWTYDLDGSLRAAPRSEREDIDLSDVSLSPVRLEDWGPFRFVNLDDEAPPLAELLGEIPERIGAAGLDVDDARVPPPGRLGGRRELEDRVRELPRVLPLPRRPPGLLEHGRRVPGQLRARGRRLALEPVRATAEPRRRRASQSASSTSSGRTPGINIFPGRPNLSIGPILPLAPDRTRRVLDYFFAPDATDDWIAEFLEFDDQVGREDARLVELVQRGAGSGVIPEGRLLPESERLVAGFQARVREALTRLTAAGGLGLPQPPHRPHREERDQRRAPRRSA